MTMKKIALLVGLAALSGGGWLYQTPYQAIDRLEDAAQKRDTATLNDSIDYPAVRESLKSSLSDSLSSSLLGQTTDNGMKAFAGMFAAAMLKPVIDSLVTPEGLSLLLQADVPDPKTSAKTETADRGNYTVSKGYDGLNRFRMTVSRATPAVTVNFVFEREGLTAWKLREVTLPDSPVVGAAP